jgi:hypothetical protein
MAYQDGNLRIPAVYCYVRERYLHMWLGTARNGRRDPLLRERLTPRSVKIR